MAVFMFVPFPEDMVTRSTDGYFKAILDLWAAARHPEDQLRYAGTQIWWERTPLEGDDKFCTSFKDSEEVEKIWHTLAVGPAGITKYAKKVKANAATKALAGIGMDDMLFIPGHSSYQGGYLVLKFIREQDGKKVVDKYWIRVDVLADMIKAEGLSALHKNIKLNSCYGGGSAESDNSLAKDLAIQLQRRGYLNLKVGAYQYITSVKEGVLQLSAPGTTVMTGVFNSSTQANTAMATVSNPFSVKNNPSSDLVMYEADPYRCWYDGSGTCVRWNVPDGYYGEATDLEYMGEKTGTQTVTQMPLLANDPNNPMWQRYEKMKRDEAAWIAAMDEVVRKAKERSAARA